MSKLTIVACCLLFIQTTFASNDEADMKKCMDTLSNENSASVPFSANLTYLNHGGLLNTNSTWVGSDDEFRKIIKTMAAKSEVQVFISAQSPSLAGFTDLNIQGAKDNVKQFLIAYYDHFYRYSTASDKQEFLDKALNR